MSDEETTGSLERCRALKRELKRASKERKHRLIEEISGSADPAVWRKVKLLVAVHNAGVDVIARALGLTIGTKPPAVPLSVIRGLRVRARREHFDDSAVRGAVDAVRDAMREVHP